MYFLRDQFQKCIIWGSSFENNFENVFFQGATIRMYFLREQFWECIYWGSNPLTFSQTTSLLINWPLFFKRLQYLTAYQLNLQNYLPQDKTFMVLTYLNTNPEYLIKLVESRFWKNINTNFTINHLILPLTNF